MTVEAQLSNDDFVKARTLRERADTLLRESVEAGNADCWGETIRHAMIDAAMVLYTEATQLEGRALEPHDIERWGAFLPTVHVGGALPVTFWVDGHCLVVEVIVPYEPPEPQEPDLRLFVDTAVPGKTKIPLAIAKGFPVPVSARYKLPPYHEESAARFVRHIVRQLYLHEVDEQLRVGIVGPSLQSTTMLRELWCVLRGHANDQSVTLDVGLTLRVCSRCSHESWSGLGDYEDRARARRLLADGKLPAARVVPR